MSAGRFDLIIYCGETLDSSSVSFTWSIDSVVVNLTGYSARAMCREAADPASALVFDWSTANGKLVITPASGTIDPVVAASETSALWVAALTPQEVIQGRQSYLRGYWDVEVTNAAGRVKRLLQGRVLLVPEVTQP